MIEPLGLIDFGEGVTMEGGVEFRLRDGVALISDHYYPPGGGAHPTLLMRQPYGRDIASTVVFAHPAWYARHGFNVVIQDVRGRGDSGGKFYPFRDEGVDGRETIEWLAQRPECNGRIGMYGFSYQGSTQLLAAAEGCPALQAIAPMMTAADLYHGWFYRGGLLRLNTTLGWGAQMLAGDAIRLKLPALSAKLDAVRRNLLDACASAPIRDLDWVADPSAPSYLRDWLDHAEPGPYWTDLDISTRAASIRIPALHLAGWHDFYAEGAVDGYRLLRSWAATPAARDGQYLIVGPWQHIPWGRFVGEADFGENAVPEIDALQIRWFNHWLKDSGEFATESRVQLFDLGTHDWRERAELPGLADDACTYFLHSGGKAQSCSGDGVLDETAPLAAQPRDVCVVDPEVPVGAPGAFPGAYRQNRAAQGNNVLCYTSQPLPQSLALAGQAVLQITVQSTSAHFDLVARLTQLKANAEAWNLTLAAQRFHDLTPNTPHKVTLIFDTTCCHFQPGEAFRLEISGHAFPWLDRNPHTGENPASAGPHSWRRSTFQILHEPGAPSRLCLPLR